MIAFAEVLKCLLSSWPETMNVTTPSKFWDQEKDKGRSIERRMERSTVIIRNLS